MSDLFGVTFLLAAVALLLGDRPGPAGPISGGALLVAGIATGLALGAKLSFALPVAVLLAGVVAFAPRGGRRRAALLALGPTLVTGGFWYLRDFAYTLNPFPYVHALGPIDLPGPDEGLNGGPPFSVAHYLTDGRVWDDWFLPGLRDQVGHVWFVLLGLCLVGIATALWQRRDRVLLSFAAAALAAPRLLPAHSRGRRGAGGHADLLHRRAASAGARARDGPRAGRGRRRPARRAPARGRAGGRGHPRPGRDQPERRLLAHGRAARRRPPDRRGADRGAARCGRRRPARAGGTAGRRGRPCGGARACGRDRLAANRALSRSPLPHRRRAGALQPAQHRPPLPLGQRHQRLADRRPRGSSSTASTAPTSQTTSSTWAGWDRTTASGRSRTAAPGAST